MYNHYWYVDNTHYEANLLEIIEVALIATEFLNDTSSEPEIALNKLFLFWKKKEKSSTVILSVI